MSGTVLVSDFINRGLSVAGRAGAGLGSRGPIHYNLGKGNLNPEATHPGTLIEGRWYSDCSGFVTWMMKMKRQVKDPFYLRVLGGWVSTDSMFTDAKNSGGFLTKIDVPRVGCFILYPRNSRHVSGALRGIGHVGIVTEVVNNVVTKVLHCSSGNDRKLGYAIAVTDAEVFKTDKTIYAWWDQLAA